MLMLGMITLLRIAANFYFGKPIIRHECGFTEDKGCPCAGTCPNPGNSYCFTEIDCQGAHWGWCNVLPLESCTVPMIYPFISPLKHVRLAEMQPSSREDGRYYEYAFDFTVLVDFFGRPLISALGVYILLRRADRFAAKSQLHVWSYRSVLWLFLASLLFSRKHQ